VEKANIPKDIATNQPPHVPIVTENAAADSAAPVQAGLLTSIPAVRMTRAVTV
jgi:hypothetical protein